jgi:hypothetical protein
MAGMATVCDSVAVNTPLRKLPVCFYGKFDTGRSVSAEIGRTAYINLLK